MRSTPRAQRAGANAGGSYEVEVSGTATTARQYYSIAGMTVAMKVRAGDTPAAWSWFLTDHLVSVVGVTDESGALTGETRYMPFGEVRTDVGTIVSTDFGYTFQKVNSYIKLLDYRFRSYSPELGRFVSPDTIVPDFANPQTINRYSYVNNRPINFNDPNGHNPCNPNDGDYNSTNCVCQITNNCGGLHDSDNGNGNDDISNGLDYVDDNENIDGEQSPGDCTNYVSKCWNSAGQSTTDIWRPDSDAWINTTKFVEYWSPYVHIEELYNTPGILMMDNALLVDQVKNLDVPLFSIVVYDDTSRTIINAITGQPEPWDHAAIVVGQDVITGIPIISEHNGPYWNSDYPELSINRRSMLDSTNHSIGKIWILFYPGLD